MRITQHQREIIVATIRSECGQQARVHLFGSRLDDNARGGDLDLLVELNKDVDNRAALASRLAALLQIALGDQRIDILLIDPKTRLQPVHKTALSEGTPL
jgi:predicted nucleotidyltransferase